MNGVKDNETMQNVSLDCYLGRWHSSVRTRRHILYSHQNMPETEARVNLCYCCSAHASPWNHCWQFRSILDTSHIQDYTYEQQLRTVNKLWRFVNSRNNNLPTSPLGFLLLQPYLPFHTSAVYFYANETKVN